MYEAGPYKLAHSHFEIMILWSYFVPEGVARPKASIERYEYSVNDYYPVYDWIDLTDCTETNIEQVKEYWEERDTPLPNHLQLLCLPDTDVTLASDKIFHSKYRGLMIELEYCPSYWPERDCLSEKEHFHRVQSIKQLSLLFKSKQLHIKNNEHPLQGITTGRNFKLIDETYSHNEVLLLPNEFTDESYFRGLFGKEFEPTVFLTIESIIRSTSLRPANQKTD